MIGVYRLETQMLPGNGKFERTGIGTDREAKESTNTAFNYLKANSNAISGSISTTNKDYMQAYFKSDDSMLAALHCTHTKYQLTLDHNNWWECFVIDPEGDFHDLMWALDSDDIFEEIWEIIDGMEETIEDITKPDWRAKS